MKTVANKIGRVLGIAFLLQFITSFSSGSFIKPLWFVEDDIQATMLNIAENPNLLRLNILLDMLTALGVIFLGAMLFVTLRKQSEKVALVGLGFYILEAGLLATSQLASFSLLGLSMKYASTGQPDTLPVLANLALESMDYIGGTLHMLAFCPGAILFYALLYKSRLVPRGLSLWGLVTIVPPLVGILAMVFNAKFPFAFFIPYVPFELVLGIWILIKGIPESNPAT